MIRTTMLVVVGLAGCAGSPRVATQVSHAPPAPPVQARSAMGYPETRVQDIKDSLFGVTVADPYRWLEEIKSDEVKHWMSAQDELARAFIAKLPGREAL